MSMQTIHVTTDNFGNFCLSHTACTIGHFDGVHLGHRHVVERLKAISAERGQRTMVVTFDRHPRTLFDPAFTPHMLISIPERLRRLELLGVDICAVLRFDHDMARFSAREFMEKVLRDALGTETLLLGYDNRFGCRQPGEGFADYQRYGAEMGVDVVPCDTYQTDDGIAVSSSVIRQLLADGNHAAADSLLGWE